MRPTKPRAKRVYRKRTNTKRMTKSRIAHSLTKPQKLEVKKLIRAPAELKYVSQILLDSTQSTFVNFNSLVGAPADFYRMLPPVAQGNDVYNRIGNKINPVKSTTHFNFKFGKYGNDSNARDITVVLYIIKPKFQKAYESTAVNNQLSSYYSGFLDNGQGTDTSFTGTWYASKFPINNEGFVLVKKKEFRLEKPSGYLNDNGVTTSIQSYGANNHWNKQYTYTCRPHRLLYDNASKSLPTNYNTMFMIGYYYTDGTAPDTDTGILQVDAITHLWYKDE